MLCFPDPTAEYMALLQLRVSGHKIVIQLPHKGYGFAGSLNWWLWLVTPLCQQGLDLYAALAHQLVMPTLLHASHQALTDVGIGVPTPDKLALDLSLTPQCTEIHSLILGPVRLPGGGVWYWG